MIRVKMKIGNQNDYPQEAFPKEDNFSFIEIK